MLQRIFCLVFVLLLPVSFSRQPAAAQNYVYQSSIADSNTTDLLVGPVADAPGNIYVLPFGTSDTKVRKYA